MEVSSVLPIYQYRDYRKYIRDQIGSFPNQGRGVRAKLAEAIRCHLPFITHVLAGRNEFSPEQTEAAARFFGLDPGETEFFLLLVSYNRAGTPELRQVLDRQLDDRVQKFNLLKNRLKIEGTLSLEDQTRYYSHWHYAAIHMALTVPTLRTRAALALKLKTTEKRVRAVLEFLVSRNLVKRDEREFIPTEKFIHLERTAAALTNHHANWRHCAIDSLLDEKAHDLHYSGVVTCSFEDLPKIRERIAQALKESIDVIKVSREETLAGICLDFFEV